MSLIEAVSFIEAALIAAAPLAAVLIRVVALVSGAVAESVAFSGLSGDERRASLSRSCEPCDARNGSALRVRSWRSPTG